MMGLPERTRAISSRRERFSSRVRWSGRTQTVPLLISRRDPTDPDWVRPPKGRERTPPFRGELGPLTRYRLKGGV